MGFYMDHLHQLGLAGIYQVGNQERINDADGNQIGSSGHLRISPLERLRIADKDFERIRYTSWFSGCEVVAVETPRTSSTAARIVCQRDDLD